MSEHERHHEHDRGGSLTPTVPDITLQMFVVELMAHDGDEQPSSIEITLTVPGGLLTGRLVSPLQWLREIQKTPYGIFLGIFEEGFVARSQHARTEEVTEDEVLAITYVHLLDAQLVAAGSAAVRADSTAPWRGRLSEVAGWSFGRLPATRA